MTGLFSDQHIGYLVSLGDNLNPAIYRVWQFSQAIFGKPTAGDLDAVRELLSPELFLLFEKFSPAEQAHAIRVWRDVEGKGFNNPALASAALLHDIGKIRRPLSVYDRVLVVLGNAIFPKQVKKWEQGKPGEGCEPFVVASRHARWGAEMIAAAGSDKLTIKLVLEHQSANPAGLTRQEKELLDVLRLADNQS